MTNIPEKINTVQEEEYNRKTARSILKGFGKKRPNLIPILQKVQGKLGYLPREAMTEIAEHLNIPAVDVYGVITFYNQFRLNPPGKHSVRVCLGTACHVRGSHRVLDEFERILGIKAGENTDDLMFTLETVNCVGACALGPVVMVGNEYFGNMSTQKAKNVIDKYYKEESRNG